MCQCNRCGACSLNCQRGDSPRLKRAPRTPLIVLPRYCGDLHRHALLHQYHTDWSRNSICTYRRIEPAITPSAEELFIWRWVQRWRGTQNTIRVLYNSRREGTCAKPVFVDYCNPGCSQRKGRKGQFSVLKGSKAY